MIRFTFGEMAEWSIAAVLKTVEANYLQGFESQQDHASNLGAEIQRFFNEFRCLFL